MSNPITYCFHCGTAYGPLKHQSKWLRALCVECYQNWTEEINHRRYYEPTKTKLNEPTKTKLNEPTKTKLTHEEIRARKNAHNRVKLKKYRTNLSDGYLRSLLSIRGHLSAREIPQELLEIQRHLLIFKRKLKGNTNGQETKRNS